MEKIVKKEHSEGKGEAIAGTLTQKKHAEACFFFLMMAFRLLYDLLIVRNVHEDHQYIWAVIPEL